MMASDVLCMKPPAPSYVGPVAPITNKPTPLRARCSMYAAKFSFGRPSVTHQPAKCALIAIRFRSVTPRMAIGENRRGNEGLLIGVARSHTALNARGTCKDVAPGDDIARDAA